NFVARKQQAPKYRAYGLVIVAGLAVLTQPIEKIQVCLELVGDVLGHVAKISSIRPFDGAGIRGEITRQHAQQRGLAHAVGSDDGKDRKSTRLNSSHVKRSYTVF